MTYQSIAQRISAAKADIRRFDALIETLEWELSETRKERRKARARLERAELAAQQQKAGGAE